MILLMGGQIPVGVGGAKVASHDARPWTRVGPTLLDVAGRPAARGTVERTGDRPGQEVGDGLAGHGPGGRRGLRGGAPQLGPNRPAGKGPGAPGAGRR